MECKIRILCSQSTYTMILFRNSGQSKVNVSYSPPSPHIFNPYFSCIFNKWGCISRNDFPKCRSGYNPKLATFIIIAWTLQSIISCSKSFWSRRQRYERLTRPSRLQLKNANKNQVHTYLHIINLNFGFYFYLSYTFSTLTRW